MKRVVSLSLLVLFVLLAIAAGWFYFQRNYGITGGKAINAVPADAAFFIETDVSADIVQKFLKTPYWKELQSAKYFKNVNIKLLTFDSLLQSDDELKKISQKEKLIISTHVTKANEFDFLFLMHLPVANQDDFADEVIKKLTNENDEPNTRSYGDVDIKELTLKNGSVFTYAVSKNIFIGSFTAFLVEDAIRQQKVNARFFVREKSFNEIYDNASPDKSTRLFISYNNLPEWLSVFKDANKISAFSQLKNFASWTKLNLEVTDNSLLLNGNSVSNDSSEFAFYLHSQQPVAMDVFKILPKKTAVVISVGISDKQKFFPAFQKYLNHAENAVENNSLLSKIKLDYKFAVAEKFYGITGSEFALLITEPASSNYDNSSYFILKTNDLGKAKKTLQALSLLVDKKQNEKTMLEKYHNFSIGLVRLQGLIPALYGNVFSRVNKMYYTIIGNYIVFANQAVALRALIDDYTEKKLLTEDENFKSASAKLSFKTNYFLYSRIPASRYIFKSVLSAQWNYSLDSSKKYFNKWSVFAYNVNGDVNSLPTSVLLQYNAKSVSDETSLIWSSQLDTSISMKPQVIIDHSQNTHFIMVQDDANNFYLIDYSGNIVWKKKLTEKIIGDIHTIDLYKNNSSQYLFNTTNYLFVVDINGNTVSNFPIRLPTPATNALAVFDFENTNDCHIYVACSNGKVYGYESSGKPLSGWNFEYKSGIINQPVQLFNVNGKNYLVMSDNGGTVFILDSVGHSLINTTGKVIRKSNVDFYLRENEKGITGFTTKDATGNIIDILLNGEIETNAVEAISGAEDFISTDLNNDRISDYVFLDKDNVSGYTNQMALLFNQSLGGAKAETLKLFKYGNNKTAIGVISSSSNKIFLLNADGSMFKGFPVKGSTAFEIDPLNNDGKFYLIAASEDGNVYMYSINNE